jgi:hypothetical protein
LLLLFFWLFLLFILFSFGYYRSISMLFMGD